VTAVRRPPGDARFLRGTRRRTVVAAVVAALTGVALLGSPPAAQATDGPVYAWGDNSLGQLADGGSTGRTTPGPVPSVGALASIAGGRGHVLGLRDDGSVVAWGSNEFGEIGDGTTVNRRGPVVVAGLPTAASIATGHYHSLVVGTDGSLWDWGYNAFGQLGLGTTSSSVSRPARVNLSNVVEAVGGREHSLARTATGEVWAWGSNASGEVGDGTTTRRTTPVRVTGLPAVVGIAAARNTSYAWTAAGALWAWGLNDYGQVGDGTTTNRATPVPVTGVNGVTQLSAGAFHVVARTTAGTVWSWGFNSYGNLGDGTTTRRSAPVQVAGLSDVREIATGRDHSMAVTSTGGLLTWGRNDFGQLGDGTTTNRTRPVPVTQISDIAEVTGGRDYTVVVVDAAPDVTAPDVPGTPRATAQTASSVQVTWAASHDDRALVIRYTIYRDAAANLVGSVQSSSTGDVTFLDTGLEPGSTHSYAVSASDGANTSALSAWSDPVTVPVGNPPLLQSDFSNGLSGWSPVVNMGLDSTRFPPGSTAPSIRSVMSDQAGNATAQLAATAPAVCAQANVLVATLTSPTLSLLRLRSAGGTSIGRVYVNSSGFLAVRADITGAVMTSSTRLPFGSWNLVRICGRTGPSGSWQIALNGVSAGSWSASNGTADFGRIQIGDADPRTATLNLDDVLVTAS